MDSQKTKPTTIDEYIAAYPKDVQDVMQEIRAVIKEAAPDAAESISYGMPTFKLNGPVVYFGAHKHHIGFYPVPSGMEAFKEELAPYASGKGSAQFPLDQPMPFDLIRRITLFRVEENRAKAKK